MAVDAIRARYAETVMTIAGSEHPRVREAFATISRERFLPPPPWTVISAGTASTTRDPEALYDNVLVSLDRGEGINNGEPALHAAWLALVDPQPGERVVHVGAGAGYYTAILARLVTPGGRVEAYEVHPRLAQEAARHLADEPGVTVHAETAFGRPLPPADLVYVNAGVFAPDPEWLRALEVGGRLVFPWQPASHWGPAILVTRRGSGYAARPLMQVGFITCSGQGTGRQGELTGLGFEATRSVWLRAEREPDATATAVYEALWFSSDAVP
ncbi:MAG TPA: SAM-dependent methyltransferase [Microvirga sp.]|jgi:protein-L-isoaspartate(D-aspartate) O-methyltransferase|nr:SAM-dependent methyltransferase [Microvirga sp.]